MEGSDTDFHIAAAMIRVLVKHSSKVFYELPEEVKPIPRRNRKEEFLQLLRAEFNRQVYQRIARKQGIP
ncbi:MAG: hypothetical protein V2I46_02320, partial [Bacteroides sp.]|nr:hypothetical protein [Bacteroides sp.]